MNTENPSIEPTANAIPTTIVGGRPTQDARSANGIPRGLEVLLKKAAVDQEFREILLEKRSDAGGEIGLALDPAEATLLDAMPTEQLRIIIRRTKVQPEDRRAFLGKVASVMFAALGAGVSGCKDQDQNQKKYMTKGHRADRVERKHITPTQSQQEKDDREADA